ncbi:MAG: hypothetical protein ABL971_08130 [Vicinamibacterales bacterium]
METLRARLKELFSLLSLGRLDVPDGLLDRQAAYALNGQAYEVLLGRSADDPLVRLIARGPAGYRFAAQALIRALGKPTLVIERWEDAQAVIEVAGRLSGTLRGSSETIDCPVTLHLTTTPSAGIATAAVTIDPRVLARIDQARALS